MERHEINTFVSYHYTGKLGNTVYVGFGNMFVDINRPGCQSSFEDFEIYINKIAVDKHGFDTIHCDILFFKQTSVAI